MNDLQLMIQFKKEDIEVVKKRIALGKKVGAKALLKVDQECLKKYKKELKELEAQLP